MLRGAVRAVVAGAATAAVASCGGGTASTTPTPAPTAPPTVAPVVTPATVAPHDIAVAIRKVTGQGATELANMTSDLQNSPTLDVAAQTMGGHASFIESLHQTLEQLPAFPAPPIQADVHRLSTDLDSLSALISAMVAGEVSQYGQFRSQINAKIPVVSRDITTVNSDLAPY
jgi:hypothetical protein